MFSIKEASKYLGVSKAVVYNRYHSGDIPGKVIKGVIMFERSDLDDFKANPPQRTGQIGRVEEAISRSGIDAAPFIHRGRFFYIVQEDEYIIRLNKSPSKMTISQMAKCIKSQAIMEKLYSTEEAAEILGIKERRLILNKHQGKIEGKSYPVVGGGVRLKFSQKQIDDFVNAEPPEPKRRGRPPGGRATNE